jgi:hypothetical protein
MKDWITNKVLDAGIWVLDKILWLIERRERG